MKIWILNHVALKPDEAGITRHYDLAKVMVDKGHEVTIFASSFLAYLFKWRNSEKKNYSENVNGVLYEWLWTFPYYGNGIRRIFNMISYFFVSIWRGFRIKERPDVIVGSSVHLFACLAAYVLARFKKSVYVVEIRDLWPRTLIDFGAMSERHPAVIVFSLIEKFIYKKADQIIVTLPGAVSYIKNFGVPEDRIHYIPNGISLTRREQLNNISSLEREIAEIRKKHKNIAMYVGAHGVANSLKTIIESVSFLSNEDVGFVLIGDGPEKENLKKRALNLDNIYFFNSIPKNQVLSTLSLADVLLVAMLDTPLYKYGISLNKLNDYLLVGKPILFAGNVYNNIVEDAKAGITVKPEDLNLFAEGIKKILQMNSEQLDSIKQTSYDYLYNNHEIEKLAQKFIDVCELAVKVEKSFKNSLT